VTAKEKLRRAIEELSESEAEDALRYLARGRDRENPLLVLLADAPDDDAPTSAEEEAGAREAWAEYERCESTPLEQARRKLS
jgi:hypothetical protein